MDELLGEFITESSENIAALDLDLITLESHPNNPDLISRIFRAMHTIKGTCGFIGLPQLEKVAHAGENILGALRDGTLEPTSYIISLVLSCLDRIKFILNHLEKYQTEPSDDGQNDQLIERLNKIDPENSATPSQEILKNEDSLFEDHSIKFEEVEKSLSLNLEKEDVHVPFSPSESGSSPKSIRVNVDLLENLMTMVSELVLTRNQLLQTVREGENTHLLQPLQRLNTVTSELQDGVMKTRMQPIGNAWSKLPRLVRDLSLELNKTVELTLKGAETELDRQVLELIKDPLTHMVRNSVDHGIETPEERIQAGKIGPGRITLYAYHQGGHIIIEIKDNGRGINVKKVREIALKKNLMSLSEADTLSPAQIAQYIFLPGFSTANQVSNVSGRGVGMDVVRNNIEKIGGTIELYNTEGEGTQFKIKIPLTLAIISGLIVGTANERFVIPQICINELVHVGPGSVSYMETLYGAPFLRLRNHVLPVCYLDEILNLREPRNFHEAIETKDYYVVIMQVGTQTFGIVVDQVFETQEIVVKPVPHFLKHISIYLGNAILGDGQVIMILDANGIANQMIKISSEEKIIENKLLCDENKEIEKIPFLLFRAGKNTLKTVPLALISRLEEIETRLIEKANGHYLIQYREQLMPLLSIDDGDIDFSRARQSVLVFSENNQFMGLLIDEIIDIVPSSLDIKMKSDIPSVLGNTIILEHTTEILNVDYYIRKIYPEWSVRNSLFKTITANSKQKNRRILLIEEESSARTLLATFLSLQGYTIQALATAEEVLEFYHQNCFVDLILYDVHLKTAQGVPFAQFLKSFENWHETPFIALLTSSAVLSEIDPFLLKRSVFKESHSELLSLIEQSLASSERFAA